MDSGRPNGSLKDSTRKTPNGSKPNDLNTSLLTGSSHPGVSFVRAKTLDLLPLVRYIPAQEAATYANGPRPPNAVDVPLDDQHAKCVLCSRKFQPPAKTPAQNAGAGAAQNGQPEALTQFQCGHVFHRSCAQKWMRENATCPLCKKDIYPPEAIQKGSDWSAMFNVLRDQNGAVRRAVDVEHGHTVQLPRNVGIWAYVCFSADNKYLAVGSVNHSVHVLDTATASEIRAIADEAFSAFCFSKDGRSLVTGDTHGKISIWDAQVANKAARRALLGHQDKITNLDLSADGRALVSVSKDQTLRIWDMESGNALRSVQTDARPLALHLTPDARWVKAGLRDGSVTLWDAQTGAVARHLRGSGALVNALALMPAGNGVLVGADGALGFWDAAMSTSGGGGDGDDVPVSPVSLVSPVSPISPSEEEDEDEMEHLTAYTGHQGEVWAAAIWREGPWVASGDENGEVHVWNIHTGELQCLVRAHDENKVRAVAFSPQGTHLAACDTDGRVRIWRFAAPKYEPRVSRPAPARAPPPPPPNSATPTTPAPTGVPLTRTQTISPARHPGLMLRLQRLLLCQSAGAHPDEK